MIKYYVRVSIVEQKLNKQLLAYDKADIVYSDKVSGKDKERPQLKVMLEGLQKADIVVVKSLDRLSRSTMDLLERKNINQRVREGVAIAKAEGKYKGRKKGSIELKGDSLNRFKMFYNKGFNKTELSKEFGVPRATIYRMEKVLKERGEL